MAGRGEVVIKILGDAGGLKGALDEGASSLDGFAGAAMAGFAAVVAAAAAVAVALFGIGEQFEESSFTIERATGETGASLDALKSTFDDVVTEVPASFGDAAMAVGRLHAQLDLNGSSLKYVAENVTELNRITGGDMATTVAGAADLFANWDVQTQDMVPTLDGLLRASQHSGTGVQTLMEQIRNSGGVMREMGFSLDQTSALLATFDKAGLNANAVVAGLKKGLASFAKDGEEPRAALARLVDEIQNAPRKIEGTALALQVFGNRSGAQLADAIQTGRFSYQELLDVIAGGSTTIKQVGEDTMTIGDKFELLKNKVFVALEPVATKFFDAISDGIDDLGPAFDEASNFVHQFEDDWTNGTDTAGVKAAEIKDFLRGMRDVFNDVFGAVSGFISDFVTDWETGSDKAGVYVGKIKSVLHDLGTTLKAAFDALKAIISTVVDVIEDLWNRFGQHLVDHLRTAFGIILDTARDVLNIFKGIFDIFAGIFTGDWDRVWNGVKEVFAGAWNFMVDQVRAAINLISTIIGAAMAIISAVWHNIWDGIKNALSSAWNEMVSQVSGALDQIGAFVGQIAGKVFGVVGDVFNAAWSVGKSVVDGIIAGVNAIGDIGESIGSGILNGIRHVINPVIGTIEDAINTAIDGANEIPFVDIGHVHLPRLAQGGVIDNPMLAVVGDAGPGNPEIVTPENLMRKIVKEELGASGSGGTTLIVHGNVYSPDDMHSILEEHDRQLRRRARARRR